MLRSTDQQIVSVQLILCSFYANFFYNLNHIVAEGMIQGCERPVAEGPPIMGK